LIGALIMTHSDDGGLVIPPRVAPIHVAIVPIYRKEEERTAVLERAQALAALLRDDGLSVELDAREGLKPGAKYYEWERKGVPLRLEIGPRDLEAGTVMAKRRPAGSEKEKLPMEGLGPAVGAVLDELQADLYARARSRLEANTVLADTWDDFAAAFEGAGSKFVHAHWDGTTETELAIKEATKATIRCLPFEGQGPPIEPGRCIKTGRPSARRVLFAKNY
jgi:prolyl-tRNA synthetase